MKRLQIKTTDIFLENYEIGKGKIIISDLNYGYNYANYWGAMGQDTTIEKFLQQINAYYFTDKLLINRYEFDSKNTFKELRKHIFSEILPYWYKHIEFQKDLRIQINEYERECNDSNGFMYLWNNFIEYSINYYLIDDRLEREDIESSFKGICEPWNFIQEKHNREYLWLVKLHGEIKKYLKNENT